MFCSYQEREEVEDELYAEYESEGSEVDSELELQLYSQLHYASNTGEREKEGEKEPEHHQPSQSHDEGENYIRQLLKHHTEQSQEAAAEKEVEGRRSTQEQVIVIDSSTEVITISEDDTDNRVCHVKGRRLGPKPHPLKASILAQQKKKKKKKRSPSLDSVVVLVSEESESQSSPGSESESQPKSKPASESESDGLESWMILGGGRQEEDSSIQLNLEGGAHSNAGDVGGAGGVWVVSGRDREAQISNRDKNQPFRRVSARYYTDKNVTCINCNKIGHLSKSCSEPRKVPCCALCGRSGHLMRMCPSRHCMNCGLPGHLYQACLERSYWHKHCHRCGMTGHFQDACPEIWRQYHITIQAGPPKQLQSPDNGKTPPYCYNCSRKGHFGHDCSQRRMFNGTYPSTPYINYYDIKGDFNRRDYRIQQRVQELTEAGLFPSELQTPHTPDGPPKKKQKSSANHCPKPSHTPYQNHKPVRIPNLIRNQRPMPAPGHSKPGQAKTWMPKTKIANKQQQHSKQKIPKHLNTPKIGSVVKKPATLMVDEAQDFPRGGDQKKKNKKKKKKKKEGMVPEDPPVFFDTTPSSSRPPRPGLHPPERLFGKGKTSAVKNKKIRARGRDRKAANMAANEMYPTDENLFIIKQRKRQSL
ncbi:zinc finger CCHC domain-containing protein 7 isoform X2 [Hypomesus transpacificus]|uniref:zinc finger CCHC domain-containing protein 7 isoform X2 n=1 Tax=Hypomesus transpacificus TaxID=137520 RepID=UPI001F08800D|nr:zinc finger CCHC domain-containing protein 7 isoform X2 [Hypomesus transpacificus]